MMLTKEECEKALNSLYKVADKLVLNHNIFIGSYDILKNLIEEHFSNPPLKCEERVKSLEKQLDIAIKDLCLTAKGADACNSLDDLYEGIKEKIEEQARKEVQE